MYKRHHPSSWYRILTVKSLILWNLTILGTARLTWFPDRYRYFLLRVSICLSHEDGRMWVTTAAITPVWESCHAADAWAPDLGLAAHSLAYSNLWLSHGFGQRLQEQDRGLKKKSCVNFFLDIKVHKDFISESFTSIDTRFNEQVASFLRLLWCVR